MTPRHDNRCLSPGPGEHLASLTRNCFILQRSKGHRYSVDDLLVAHLASTIAVAPRRVLDLGCGIGSVLLMVGWALPEAQLVGVEAQQESIALAQRNVALNGFEARAKLFHLDLRDREQLDPLGEFDLVTATPPYLNPKAATPCSDAQRAYAKFEMRGGIEEYARAAARVLSRDGLFVACVSTAPEGRAVAAFEQAGLHVRWTRDVLPRVDRAPFLALFVGAREPPVEQPLPQPPLVLREIDGQRSAEHAAIREWFGLPASRY